MSKYLIHKAVEYKNTSAAFKKLMTEEDVGRDWIAQPKHDGCNVIVHWSGTELTACSRTGEPVAALDHIASFFKAIAAVPGYYLGEAWHPNLKFPEISGIFRRKRLDYDDTLLHLVVFDYLTESEWAEGATEVPYVQRVTRLGDSFLDIPNAMRGAPAYPIIGFGINPWDRIGGHTPLSLANELQSAGGYDGLILRNPWGTWEAGSSGKHGEIIKVKPLIRVSCEVTGFSGGKGKHAGKVGTLLVNYNGLEQGAGTGLKDSERHVELFNRDWLGKLVEIEALGVTDDGYLREPRLLGIRTDVVEAD